MEFIERLEFGTHTKYSALEASVHLGRYLIAGQYCRNKKVLDIASGEGYGSFVLADKWGAKEVYGVDISEKAIEKAKANFGGPNIRFSCMNAESDQNYFEERSFDVIVSFETIEHLSDPKAYLNNLKRWIRKDGVIIISCPNDNWYYNTPDSSNPFHEQKYTFEEFAKLCEEFLGKSRGFLFGIPVSGFSNVPAYSSLLQEEHGSGMSLMFDYKETHAIILPSTHNINSTNVSYFVGIWGPQEIRVENTSCLYPASMDESRAVAHSEYMILKEEATGYYARLQELNETAIEQIQKLDQLKMEKEILAKDNEQLKIGKEMILEDNKLLKTEKELLLKENDHLKLEKDFLERDKIRLREELNNTTVKYETEMSRLSETLIRLSDELELLKKENHSLLNQNKKLAISVKGTNKENEFIRQMLWLKQNQKNDSRIEQLEREIYELLHSKSWRITAPLRKLFRFMKL